jgi:phosphoglycolate phosphatase-like HAD superfamily hydrolase
VYLDALATSVREVWGHELTPASFARAEHRPGQTAMEGLRGLLLGEGLELERIDAALARWCEVFADRYVELLAVTPTPHWELAPRAAETLAELSRAHTIALLTGNPERVARVRMERLGLAGFFPRGTGAFGCEGEERAILIGVALTRAGARPTDAVLVGDTPLDIAGARASGIGAIAVTTGPFSAAELASADVVLDGLAGLPAALA